MFRPPMLSAVPIWTIFAAIPEKRHWKWFWSCLHGIVPMNFIELLILRYYNKIMYPLGVHRANVKDLHPGQLLALALTWAQVRFMSTSFISLFRLRRHEPLGRPLLRCPAEFQSNACLQPTSIYAFEFLSISVFDGIVVRARHTSSNGEATRPEV